jgi:WD40 repeat protein
VSHERSSVHEVLLNEPCLQSALSPDGKILGCLRVDHSLTLLDVANGDTLTTKPRFFGFEFSSGTLMYLMLAERNQRLVHMEFSPDGRYFLAGSHTEVLAYDLQEKRDATLPGSIRDVLKGSFAFVGPDRIAGVNMYYAERSPLLQFPQGKRIAELPLSNTTNLEPVAHGDYLLIRPVKDHPLGS